MEPIKCEEDLLMAVLTMPDCLVFDTMDDYEAALPTLLLNNISTLNKVYHGLSSTYEHTYGISHLCDVVIHYPFATSAISIPIRVTKGDSYLTTLAANHRLVPIIEAEITGNTYILGK